jgi:hypothetical protein
MNQSPGATLTHNPTIAGVPENVRGYGKLSNTPTVAIVADRILSRLPGRTTIRISYRAPRSACHEVLSLDIDTVARTRRREIIAPAGNRETDNLGIYKSPLG